MVKRQNETTRATQSQHGGNAADVERVRRIAAGDAESVGDLYDRHVTAMYSLALRILGRETDAKDVVHEVFVRVWREAGRHQASRGIVATWLLTLTRNRALDRLQQLPAELDIRRTGDGDVWCIASAAGDRMDAMPKFDAPERLHDALRSLPDLQRIAMEMTYFEGLSQHEIANRLEQPLGTVKTLIRLALLKPRAALTWEEP